MSEVVVERLGSKATVIINRPEKRNALNGEVISQMRKALGELNKENEIRAVVITGAGDKAFCAGADLSGNGPISTRREDSIRARDTRLELARLFQDMWNLKKPTIALVRGYAMAGGFGLATACDLIIASQSAVFSASEVKVGLWPFIISIPLLRSLPPKKALELMITGARISADDAINLGFVNKVCPEDRINDELDQLISQIENASPSAIAMGKRSFYDLLDTGADTQFRYLATMLGVLSETEDAKEGITAFLEKRKAVWKYK
jgi:enoyl-CoA hydratase